MKGWQYCLGPNCEVITDNCCNINLITIDQNDVSKKHLNSWQICSWSQYVDQVLVQSGELNNSSVFCAVDATKCKCATIKSCWQDIPTKAERLVKVSSENLCCMSCVFTGKMTKLYYVELLGWDVYM